MKYKMIWFSVCVILIVLLFMGIVTAINTLPMGNKLVGKDSIKNITPNLTTIDPFINKLNNGNKFNGPNYMVWFYNQTNDPIALYDVNSRFLSIHSVKNFSKAFVLMKRDISLEPKGVISYDLSYRSNPSESWIKGNPYKKDDIVFEEPFIYNNSWYGFWIEHLTDFFVNSTVNTLSACLIGMNNTDNFCVIN